MVTESEYRPRLLHNRENGSRCLYIFDSKSRVSVRVPEVTISCLDVTICGRGWAGSDMEFRLNFLTSITLQVADRGR